MTGSPHPQLGLRENWGQFWLLVTVNFFVGSMVGLERSVLPVLAGEEFGIASAAVALSFIVAFGAVKAVTNLLAGSLADRVGRRRLLVAGWLFALPVPALVIWAPSWGWIVAANVLLGVNQGLTWSMTVVMKLDLVGPTRRGLAVGFNEAAGYVAVAIAALATGALAAAYGPRPVPFLLGFGFAVAGLALSAGFVRETGAHVALEQASERASPSGVVGENGRSFAAAAQAGFVNNLNDALAWGLVPIVLADRGLSLARIGVVAAAYPLAWGALQLGTGPLSDRTGRKLPIVAGLAIQTASIAAFAAAGSYGVWILASVGMGIGTALAYPTLIAAVSDMAPAGRRATAVGRYRLWRDLGFVAGGLLVGLLADAFGPAVSIGAVAAVTGVSGVIVAVWMRETLPSRRDVPILGRPTVPSGPLGS